MDPKAHWESVYRERGPEGVSWYQPEARLSLELIRRAAPPPAPAVLDVGGGASTLVDGLLAAGYARAVVLDLSGAALAAARERLGPERAARVEWREADVLEAALPTASVDVWHDRAVFHFLLDAAARRRYVAQVRRAVRPGGHVLVATFAEDGPARCSGLEVARYEPAALHAEFGGGFRLVESVREKHLTPWGAPQAFTYCLCRFEPTAPASSAA